jgi:hypothetical protein
MPPPFIFILNGGGVNPTRCLRFFLFRMGARESLPPFLSVSIGGSVWDHAGPRFVSFHFERVLERWDTHPPLHFERV